MRSRLPMLVALFALVCSSTALAQSESIVAGEVEEWQGRAADLVLLTHRHIPPPFVRPAGVPTVGTVEPDGSFTLSIPSPFSTEDSVGVVDFLDPGCAGGVVTPEGATYVPLAIVAYDSEGALVGEIFQASAGSGLGVGPVPGGYSIVYGYSDDGFALRGTCPDARRQVVEDYDFAVGAGWHEVVQRFEEDPNRVGWRIDRWRSEPVPEDAVWVMISPY